MRRESVVPPGHPLEQPEDGGERVAEMRVQVHVVEGIGIDLGGLLIATPTQKIVLLDVELTSRQKMGLLSDLLTDEEFAEVQALSA
jgi:hypothetical protein